MTFQESLVRLRKERKVTQAEISRETGIALRSYQYYEYGQQDPQLPNLIALADFYDISLDELVGREWPKKSSSAK